VIELQDVHKAFGPKQVLTGFTLTVRDGETLVLIGYSGTGKSVVLKHIVGLLHPDAGEVIVDGRMVPELDRAELNAVRRDIGYVFQFAALFDSMTVAENVALGLRNRDLPEAEIVERVQEALALVDLTGRRSCRAGCASGWGSPGPSPCGRATCCTTSPRRASIR